MNWQKIVFKMWNTHTLRNFYSLRFLDGSECEIYDDQNKFSLKKCSYQSMAKYLKEYL